MAADAGTVRLPILMWHHVGEAPTPGLAPYAVSADVFARQLDAVAAAGYRAVTFDDLRSGDRPERGIILTFDDGYTSFVDAAAPALSARGMRAVVFVVAGALGGANTWDAGARSLTLMDADELARVAELGHEVAVHAWRHMELTRVPPAPLRRELLAARSLLEDVTGVPVRSLSYPHGAADDGVVEAAARCGFDVACLDWREPRPGWPANLGLLRVDVGPCTTPTDVVGHAASSAVTVRLEARPPGDDAFALLVAETLAAGDGLEPAAGWAAVHRASAPLAAVLQARGAPGRLRTFASIVSAPPPGAGALAAALAPMADDLDGRLGREPPVPVWGAPTPAAAATVDLEWLSLGSGGTDLARLLWECDLGDRTAVAAAYLRGSGRRATRRAVTALLDDVAVAETALLADEAAHPEILGPWAAAEAALAGVPFDAGEPPRVTVDRSRQARRLWMALTGLVRQDLRERYGGSVLGIGWSVVRPLLTFGVLVVFFGAFVKVRNVRHYPLFLVAGLVPWAFAQDAIGDAVGALRGKGYLLRLSDFPRLTLPLACVASALVDGGFQLAVAAPVVLALGGGPPARLLVLPVVIAALVVMVGAAVLVVSGLAVRYRDVANAVPLLLTLGFYALPVVYPISQVPARWRTVYQLDPLATAIAGFRACLYGGPWPAAWAVAVAAAASGAGGWAAWRWYERTSDRFVAEA